MDSTFAIFSNSSRFTLFFTFCTDFAEVWIFYLWTHFLCLDKAFFDYQNFRDFFDNFILKTLFFFNIWQKMSFGKGGKKNEIEKWVLFGNRKYIQWYFKLILGSCKNRNFLAWYNSQRIAKLEVLPNEQPELKLKRSPIQLSHSVWLLNLN